ncbi:MAG: serine hydrolase [Bdellovibrionales bacterium]|nr:serine hydrolase [Bdellovibrionales bacterium]
MKVSRTRSILESALRQGVGSGMAASFGRIGSEKKVRHFLGTHSRFSGSLPVGEESFFDLASLTKILATTLLCMKKVEIGELFLDTRLEELLTHRSGLPAWKPFYEAMRTRFGDRLGSLPRDERIQHFNSLLDAVPAEESRRGSVVYSDLGFLHLERILGDTFEKELMGLYAQVPGLRLHYREASGLLVPDQAQYVMTELCPWRGPLQGEVHDDNAWSRGGMAGHAGLFGRLRDLELWVDALFQEKFVSFKTLREFSRVVTDISGSRRALGFDVPTLDGSGSTGFVFSPSTIGHLGFTGTSLWLDLDQGLYAILLTNRVHPVRTDDRIRLVRREFHEAVRDEWRS